MKRFIITVFILHFILVFSHLFGNIFDINLLNKITSPYINPVFEQNWSMFSKPPISTKKILFQYKIVKNTDSVTTGWYDINSSINNFNKKYYFSIAQRLIKYESGCLNNILMSIEKCENNNHYECIGNSNGFKSLMQYSKIVFNKIDVIKGNEVYFRMKILEDVFPGYNDRRLDFFDKKNHEFKEYNTDYYQIWSKNE